MESVGTRYENRRNRGVGRGHRRGDIPASGLSDMDRLVLGVPAGPTGSAQGGDQDGELTRLLAKQERKEAREAKLLAGEDERRRKRDALREEACRRFLDGLTVDELDEDEHDREEQILQTGSAQE